MTAFLALAAVMVIGALFTVLPPLLARRDPETSDRGAANIALLRRELENNDADLHAGTIDQAQWESVRREIERRVVEESQASDGEQPLAVSNQNSPRIALLLALALPIAAVSAYLLLGEPRAIFAGPQLAAESGHAIGKTQLLAMADKLAQRLKSSPDDGTGWAMLARTYAYVGRIPEATKAYQEALKRLPDDPRLLADYADFYAGTKGGGSLAGEPEKLVERALKLDPNQPKALALAGTIAFKKKDFAKAAKDWEHALSFLPKDSELAKELVGGVAVARSRAGLPVAASAGETTAGSTSSKAAAGGVSVSGIVRVAPKLASSASPTDTVFVFAHRPEGGGPPLAVMRATFGQLPLKFRLDDSMAMSPGNTLSSASRVVITARVAKSGGVMPQPGDLEGASKPVVPGATDVAVTIDKMR